MKAHGSQLRASGDPYYTHPLAVAQILADLNLDQSTVITGLLHDTVEDTLATLEDIQGHFGKDIAGLVDGVTKLSQLELQSEHTKQAENLRKLVLAMSTDIRVLLVKLADRLHNMRTLHHVSSIEKRKRVARETIEIYAPLAERMGMQYLKDELEDIAFGVMNPDARESVQSRLSFLYENADYTVEAIIDDIQRVLKSAHLANADVNGRQKTPYSIWKKMQHKRVAFEQLSDIMAFRIVVDNVGDVYQALGAVHNSYLVLPGRFKDYISTPKPNGYQSLHTGLIGPFNSRIEVQIRTQEMHLIAEYGIASHWEYKQEASHDGRQYAWLRGLLDILDQASNPEEFLENTKLEMFQDQVFCFTPKGDLIQLPGGATPVDFAYAVHSEVGNHITASKINGRLMPLRTILNNGDQVEVITSKTQNPSPTWERFVVTGKARSHIRKFIRQQRRDQFSELGRSILYKAFKQSHFDIGEKILRPAVEQLKQGTLEDLYASVGEGAVSVHEVMTIVSPIGKVEQLESKPKKIKAAAPSEGDSVSIQGLIAGMAVRYAGCCHPLPGDRISGIVKTGKGITIHTVDCEVLKAFSDPNRVLDLSWGKTPDDNHRFVGRLKATFLNKTGSLSSFSTAISKQGGNIANIKVTNRTPDFWDIMIDIEVRDAEHLNLVIASIRTLSITNSVERL
ncbi:MAG: bifunctional (p)ppGpp synthetase/guanosine-3',5'-bis(diphosphate) 3'-pyrophosphohydrolase [Candidatus Paracaedibacteraceae bacterium]|nr:bifunctional (p)ppGpp synthetase/guanosine-3',5'-bis(diphosphate) 3'-pyrophosphohydrolase [Candidatus Paracaedibacteraceae bacterium]